jgi:hypothetical protein
VFTNLYKICFSAVDSYYFESLCNMHVCQGCQTQIYRVAVKTKLLRSAIYKKSPQNNLNLIKIYSFVIFGMFAGRTNVSGGAPDVCKTNFENSGCFKLTIWTNAQLACENPILCKNKRQFHV